MLDINRLMMRADGGALGAAQGFLKFFGKTVGIDCHYQLPQVRK